MKSKLLAGLVIGLALMNSACSVSTVGSDEVSAENVHQSYNVIYSEGENKTYTDAQFRVKNSYGDTVELLYPSYVLVNNAPMNHHTFLGSSYDRDFPGFTQTVEFKFSDMEGKVWLNKATLYPVSLKTYSNQLNVGNSYRITVEAANMRSGERNEASICQDQESGSVCAYADSAGSDVVFSASEIAKLKPDITATLNVARSYSTKIDGPKGGYMDIKFSIRTVYVQVLN